MESPFYQSKTTLRSPHRAVWILSYLLSPALAFLCLRYARAIGTLETICGVFIGLIVQLGLVSVLASTDGQPLQIFINILSMISLYLLVVWQYLAGRRAGLWSEKAYKEWRKAGIGFGIFIAVSLSMAIAFYHLQRLGILPR